MEKLPAIYIMTNKPNGTLYVGVTSNLIQRVFQHRCYLCDGFTRKYHLNKLVYYEIYGDMYEAITREKKLKKWRRGWKVELIEKENPEWEDLFFGLLG